MFSRNGRPPTFLHNPSAASASLDDASEEESLVEDSLNAGPSQHRSLPQPSLFSRPPQQRGPTIEADGFAFAATPDGSAPPPPPFAPPNRYAGPASSSITPQGMHLPPAQPPRIERQQYRPQPPAPTRALPQQTLFGSPPADASSSVSSLFTFAPRAAAAGVQLMPAFAAPHTPNHLTRGGGGRLFDPPQHHPQQQGANLDSAAIAAERRIQAQRAAILTITTTPTAEEEGGPRRMVSFSTQTPAHSAAAAVVSTPQNAHGVDAVAAGYSYQAPPARPNRIAAAGNARAGRGHIEDASTSHLGGRGGVGAYGELSFSMSTDSSFPPPQPALPTRLFSAPPPQTHSHSPSYPTSHAAAFTAPQHPASHPASNRFTPHQQPSPQSLIAPPPPHHQHTTPQNPAQASRPNRNRLPSLPHSAAAINQNATSTSISISADPTNTTSSTSASLSPDSPEVVRLRKWDGTQTTVPSYIVSDQAETVVEDVFEFDAVYRFRPRSIIALQRERVAGLGRDEADGLEKKTATKPSGEDQGGERGGVDALQAILETQLGLRGMHGWFGYTYVDPKPSKPSKNSRSSSTAQGRDEGEGDGRTSRKHRRSTSPCSPSTSSSLSSPPLTATKTEEDELGDESEEEDQAPIVVYDTFGRIKGTVTLPSYASRGGPKFPLPSPRETFAIRHAAGSHLVLTSGSSSSKEARLFGQVELVKHQYTQLQTSLQNHRHGQASQEPNKHKHHLSKSTIKSDTFYTQLRIKRQALTKFQSTQKPSLLKALQNALLDSTSFPPPPHSTLPLH